MSIAVAPEVAAALARGGAVVALESTIICHGMPYPKNLQTAFEVEAVVRDAGAIPATIAILDGVPHVAMDISSDLTELGKTPVAVISAGVKSILDIPRTLEYLETQGVTVAAYRTNEFPAFFTEISGCQVPCRVDSPEECAKIIHANSNLHLGSGILIAVPVPTQHAASGNIIESAIQKALKEAEYSQHLRF
uniref:Pseudouridine-5'-phosphate glycosidase n=1 Tax=Setaria italica TaxID=4555 RepID=K4AFI7_SETIT